MENTRLPFYSFISRRWGEEKRLNSLKSLNKIFGFYFLFLVLKYANRRETFLRPFFKARGYLC